MISGFKKESMINNINIEEMKTKITPILSFFVAFVFSANAMAQNPECNTNLSLYAGDVKAGNLDGAYDAWKMVYDNCPDLHYANFAYGEKILKHKIENASGDEKTNFVNALMKLYDESLKYFPDKFTKAGVTVDKVIAGKEYGLLDDEKVYEQLGVAFKEDKDNFKNAKALYMYFSALVDLHKAGKKDLQEVFNVYDDVTEKIELENKELTESIVKLVEKEEAGTITSNEKKVLNAAYTNGAAYEQVSGSVDAKLGQLADCENLIPLYQKNFDAKKNDPSWLRAAASRMDSKECTGDPLFVKLVEELHKLEPSAESAYYLGLLKDKAGDSKGSIKYYNEAVSLQSDKYKKAKLLLRIASKYSKSGSKTAARNYANQALENNPALGSAYLILANLYANSANDCGTTAFEKRAVYWKAADLARQAAKVDPSVKSRALQTVKSYEGLAPSRTDIFNADMAGKTVKFNCWVGGSVKVPNL